MFRDEEDIKSSADGIYVAILIAAIGSVGLYEGSDKLMEIEDRKPFSVYIGDATSDGILDMIIETSNGKRFTFEGQEYGRYKGLEEFLQKN